MKKLAIVISGAVSLGTYEAGVMYELLQALQAHNMAKPADPILIDVITGASAGGMNAVILAQKLLFQPSRLQSEIDNDLYLPWVKDIDLSSLLKLNSDEPADHSIFSSDVIESISQRYLTDPYRAGINMQSEQRHPAVDAKLKLGLAMSNLNGIDYGLALLSGGVMPYTRLQDEVRVDIDSGNPDHDAEDFWEPLRNAAVACGAFPFAFRVKQVQRHPSDYADPEPLNIPATGMRFAYTDGGTFQNEPIGLAKQLVDEIDNHLNDDRYYIFVAPGMRQSAGNDFSAAPGSPYFNLLNTLKAVINGVFNQARFRDLENFEKINDKVALFDSQAAAMKALFLDGRITNTMIDATSVPLLGELFPGGTAPALNADGQAARDRLRNQFSSDYQAIATAVGPANANAWIDAILLLETVASLGPQDQMKVFAITEDAGKLAGGDLFAFGGFFDVSYRQHDYDRGRQSVRDFITWLNGAPNTGLGPIQYAMDTLPPLVINPSLDGLALEKIPNAQRQLLYKQLQDRINDLMQELGISLLVRDAFYLGFIDGFLKKQLGL